MQGVHKKATGTSTFQFLLWAASHGSTGPRGMRGQWHMGKRPRSEGTGYIVPLMLAWNHPELSRAHERPTGRRGAGVAEQKQQEAGWRVHVLGALTPFQGSDWPAEAAFMGWARTFHLLMQLEAWRAPPGA